MKGAAASTDRCHRGVGFLGNIGCGGKIAMLLCENGHVTESTVPVQFDPGTIELDSSHST